MPLDYNKIKKILLLLNFIILLVLPQLNNVHYDPLPQFWAETTFVWATISLFMLTCAISKNINIPHIVAPLILFAILLAVQPFFVPIDFVGLSYTAIIELFVCGLLAISFSTLATQYGLKTVVTYIALAFVIGAILQSAIGFFQYSGLYKYFMQIIFYDSNHPTTNIFGHFGQRNHYCHYLTWATFSLAYLFLQKHINKWVFSFLLCWFLFSITIGASRSVFLYFGAATVISGLFFIKHRDTTLRNWFLLISSITILLFIFEYVYPLAQSAIHHSKAVSSGLQRISEVTDGGVTGRRMVEWEKAWISFTQNPIWGLGFNSYAKQSVYLTSHFTHVPLNDGLFTNCHNIILQLLAETGILGSLIFLLGVSYSIYLTLQNKCRIEVALLMCMLMTTLIHSQLEYPLWYMYFLGPFILFLSFSKPMLKLKQKPFVAISIIPLIALIYLLISSSIIFDKLVYISDTPDDSATFKQQGLLLEQITDDNVLWSYAALYTLDNYINVDTPLTNELMNAKTQLEYENKFSNFHPYPGNVIKQAMLSWNLGFKEDSIRLTKIAINTYPNYKNSFIAMLKEKKYATLKKIINDYKQT